jgi:NAD(P)H dehydrogenase (quinone)
MILVTGATGHAGAVVSRLASLGHDVVAMVRDVQAASRCLPSGIALRVADYEDASALKSALAGIEDMVLISSDGNASAVMRHHANAIEAATATNIRHITFTSIVDTDELSPSNSGLCRAKRRESLCYPQDMVGSHRSRVTTWRPPSQQ